MTHRNQSPRLVRVLGISALAAFTGCQSDGAHFGPACADIPPGAIPQPSGTYACAWQTAQAERAELDDFVLYRNEWRTQSAELAPCGRAHVEVLAKRLENAPTAVLIQASADPDLDQARRATVIEALADKGVADPASRVVIGCPEAEGLYGFEAPRIVRGYAQSGTFNSGNGATGAGFGSGNLGLGGGFGGGGWNAGGFF